MRKGEGRSMVLDLASTACLVLAAFLFVNHHVVLAIAAGAASVVVSGWSGRAVEEGRIDEALAARAEWDRLHPPEDSPVAVPRWRRARGPGFPPDTQGEPPDEMPPRTQR